MTAEIKHGWAPLFIPAPDLETSELDRKLYDVALKQQVGADVIINAVVSARLRNIPMILTWGVLEIDGTAAEIIPAPNSQ